MTQGDVIRADSKDIPRIFQLLYAGEGEARKTDEQSSALDVSISMRNFEDKPGYVVHKGHEFLNISYHMPTTCEVCPKPLWNMFRPPPALECRSELYYCIVTNARNGHEIVFCSFITYTKQKNILIILRIWSIYFFRM